MWAEAMPIFQVPTVSLMSEKPVAEDKKKQVVNDNADKDDDKDDDEDDEKYDSNYEDDETEKDDCEPQQGRQVLRRRFVRRKATRACHAFVAATCATTAASIMKHEDSAATVEPMQVSTSFAREDYYYRIL